MTPPNAIRPFLAAICATPESDLPRLVLADALDAGDVPGLPADAARAEFIRVQVALSHLEPCPAENTPEGPYPQYDHWPDVPCDWCALRQRERELLTAPNFWRWFDVLPGWPGSPSAQVKGGRDVCVTYARPNDSRLWYLGVRRGFPESVTLPAADLLAHLDALLAAAPVTRVTLAEGPTVERPAGCGVGAFKAACELMANVAAGRVSLLDAVSDRGSIPMWIHRPGGTLADIPEACRARPRVTLAWRQPQTLMAALTNLGDVSTQAAVAFAELGDSVTPPPATP